MTDERRGCDFPGCGRRHRSRGLCGSHAAQRRTGKPLVPIGERGPGRPKPPPSHCDVPDRRTGEPCGLPSMKFRVECPAHAAVVAGLLRS